jgi:hypothetical protein
VAAIWESQQEWKKEGSESWEDKMGEEIDVEDWQEELGGGQTELVRSQVQQFSGRERHEFEGGLRAERKESLDEWNFRSRAVAMAEIVKI